MDGWRQLSSRLCASNDSSSTPEGKQHSSSSSSLNPTRTCTSDTFPSHRRRLPAVLINLYNQEQLRAATSSSFRAANESGLMQPEDGGVGGTQSETEQRGRTFGNVHRGAFASAQTPTRETIRQSTGSWGIKRANICTQPESGCLGRELLQRELMRGGRGAEEEPKRSRRAESS